MIRSLATLLIALPAFGAIYESPVNIEDEDDLRAMAQRGDISDATLQTLVELFQDGIDLNSASREDLYDLPGLTYQEVDAIITLRKAQGEIADPAELVTAGAITPEQLLTIAPFLIVPAAAGVKVPLSGKYRGLVNYTVGDSLAPPFVFKGTMKAPFGFSGGLNVTGTRRRVGSPFYDPLRDTLQATPATYRIEVPKFFVEWKSPKVSVLAGTFRIGFAQRLTLDTTTRFTPNGDRPEADWYVNPDWALSTACRYSAGELSTAPCPPGPQYVTDDFEWRDAFRGLSVAAENLELGDSARMSIHAFGSFQTHSIYQYEIYDRRYCLDPRQDSDSQCASPSVYLRQGDGSGPEGRVSFSTLPSIYDEIAAGGHIAFSPTPSFEIAATGYGAVPRWHAYPEMQLDFQEWSKRPFGGAFGAVGLDGRLTLDEWNLYFEVTRSFDREGNGGGGWGAVQRSVWSRKKAELEIIARFYDIRFVNPYARPVSSPDELDGQRARNEAGLRLQYTDKTLGDFQLTGNADFWVLPWDAAGLEGQITGTNAGFTAGTTNLRAELRADYKGWSLFQPGVAFRYANNDLAHSGYGACYSGSDGRYRPTVEGEPLLCTGERYAGYLYLHFHLLPKRQLDLDLAYTHVFISDAAYNDKLSQDLRASIELSSQPVDWLLLRGRVRYLKYDIFTNDRLDENLWTYVEATFLGLRVLHVTLRYDVFLWLDKRNNTLTRTPNPEHRLRLELEGRF